MISGLTVRVIGLVDESDQVRRIAGEVEIARVQDLKLQLRADREVAGLNSRDSLTAPSPACVNAIGTDRPASSSMITAEHDRGRVTNSEQRPAVPCTIAIAMPDIGVSARHSMPARRTPKMRETHHRDGLAAKRASM